MENERIYHIAELSDTSLAKSIPSLIDVALRNSPPSACLYDFPIIFLEKFKAQAAHLEDNILFVSLLVEFRLECQLNHRVYLFQGMP